MKNFIFRALCAIAFTSFAFVSCKKEPITLPIAPEQKTISLSSLADRDNEFGSVDECYNILLPINLKLEDGTIYIVDSQEDIDYFENDVNAPSVEEVLFPITLKDNATGNLTTVNSEEEFENTFEECAFEGIENDPNSEAMLSYMLVSALIDSDIVHNFNMQFPVVMISTVSGVETSLANIDELMNYFLENAPEGDEEVGSIKFVYPLSLQQSTTQEMKIIENKADLVDFVQYLWGE
jgi:hypothetical protein